MLLGVLIVVFWAVASLIEVDEYDDVTQTFDRTDSLSSYSTHVLTMLALGVAGFGFHVLAGAHWLEQTAAFLAYVVAVVPSANLYQVHLGREVACLREREADGSAATEYAQPSAVRSSVIASSVARSCRSNSRTSDSARSWSRRQ